MLEYIGMIITSPKNLVRIMLAERRSIIWGFIIVLLGSLIISINLGYVLIIKTLGFIGLNIGFIRSVSITAIVLGIVIANIVAWLLLGVLLYALDKALGGKASLESVLLIYSFQWIPLFLVGLLSPLFYYLDMITSLMILILVTILAVIWGYIIVLIANAEANGFSIAKSFLASILQLLLIFGTVVYIPVLVGVFM